MVVVFPGIQAARHPSRWSSLPPWEEGLLDIGVQRVGQVVVVGLDVQTVTVDNIMSTVVADGFRTVAEICEGIADECAAAGIS